MDSFLAKLNALLHSPCDRDAVKQLNATPILGEHELVDAMYTLLLERAHLPCPAPLHLTQYKSGAVPLFGRGYFPWGPLPYPAAHARLGAILAELNGHIYQEMAEKMVRFQDATLSHQKLPLRALFSQERNHNHLELEEANHSFFQTISFTPSDQLTLIDTELALVSQRSKEHTVVCSGTGCKSGLGLFLFRDVGIVNFGPQLLPLDNCAGFGIAGKGSHFHAAQKEEGFSFFSQCRLAAPHNRLVDMYDLEDSGYSALWIEAAIEATPHSLAVSCSFDGFRPLSSVAFSFFGQANACYVAKTHRLIPRSLDRYRGPSQPLELRGEAGSIYLTAVEGAYQMEVIPLAGDDSFWKSDFLIAYSFRSPIIKFTLQSSPR